MSAGVPSLHMAIVRAKSFPHPFDSSTMTPLQIQVQQMASVLRAQLVSLRAPALAVRTAGEKQSRSTRSEKQTTSAPQDLADVLTQRIQQIANDDPLFKRKVFKIFLESVISAEFGGTLHNDPRFGAMIDSVQMQMQADPPLDAMMDQMVEALTKPKR